MSPFEIVMLACFGVSWPVSIHKSWKSRSTKGKSLLFMALILVGYLAGILHKLFYSRDIVLALYIINFILVGVDCLLYLRNKRIETQQQDVA